MTPKLKTAIVKCAKQLGFKPTEWVRIALASAVMNQCFKPTEPPALAPAQEPKSE